MYIEHDQLQADTCVYERSRSGWVRRRLDLGLRLRLVDLDNSGARESAPYIGRPAADGVLAVGILHSGFMPATTTPRRRRRAGRRRFRQRNGDRLHRTSRRRR